MAETYSMGFHYLQGRKVGYDITYPNGFGGQSTLSCVSTKDKKRIIEEIESCGVNRNAITAERVEY